MEDKIKEEEPEDITEHRLYDLVLKLVLWDESREEIFKRMKVNKVSDEKAEQLYEYAKNERVQAIRGNCSRNIVVGLRLIAVAVIVYCSFWFGMHGISKLLFYLCAVACGFGLFKFIKGIGAYLTAPNARGSVADL